MRRLLNKHFVAMVALVFAGGLVAPTPALAKKNDWKKVMGAGAAIIGGAILLNELSKAGEKQSREQARKSKSATGGKASEPGERPVARNSSEQAAEEARSIDTGAAGSGRIVRIAEQMDCCGENEMLLFRAKRPTLLVELLGSVPNRAVVAFYKEAQFERTVTQFERTQKRLNGGRSAEPAFVWGGRKIDIMLGVDLMTRTRVMTQRNPYDTGKPFRIGRVIEEREVDYTGFPAAWPSKFIFRTEQVGKYVLFPEEHVISDELFAQALADDVERARGNSLGPDKLLALGAIFVGPYAIIATLCRQTGCDLDGSGYDANAPQYAVIEEKMKGSGQKYVKLRCRSGQEKTVYYFESDGTWRHGVGNIFGWHDTFESVARSACP